MIAAFVMFTGTGPRSVTVTKALQRMVGTTAGVAVGMLVAGFVAGHAVVAIALVLICDFLAFHAFQAAYGVMIFWITIMLSLLYGFLGLFSVSLLALRLEETGIGLAAGIVIALLLLPTGTRATLRQAAGDFVATLDRRAGRDHGATEAARGGRSAGGAGAGAGPQPAVDARRGGAAGARLGVRDAARHPAGDARGDGLHLCGPRTGRGRPPEAVAVGRRSKLRGQPDGDGTVTDRCRPQRPGARHRTRGRRHARYRADGSDAVAALERVGAAAHMLARALAGTFRAG